ncbi:DDI2-like protein [Mya arenaria]|uniref:DDI2-like protein n=1 Tax=Mya arenaria TaxID=6604 RepID=A0ABY7EWV1_MYAAR|nr:DDI2-like protein [Mya arenaria]
MNLTITTLDDRLISIEVGEDLELENLKAQCEFELGVPVQRMVLTWNGKPLNDNKKTLKQYGIGNGEMLLLQQINPSSQASQPRQSGSGASGGVPMIDFGSIAIPGNPPPPRPDLEDPLVILELIKNNPHERALLKERNPPLSDALESGNTEERNKMISMDPFSSEAQRLIAEEIRMKNVETNMESAIEHVPESFGQVVMLYVNCAQMTIMSQSCAERCNIMRLVDMRWAGIAKGVGTQKIIGRVHLGNSNLGAASAPRPVTSTQPGSQTQRSNQGPQNTSTNPVPSLFPTPNSQTPSQSTNTQGYSHLQVSNSGPNQGSTQSQGATSPVGAGPSQSRSPFPEHVIRNLVENGFSRHDVIRALTEANGDAQKALMALLARSLQFP